MITLKGKSAAATKAFMVLPMSLITPSVTIIRTWYVWFSGSRVRCDAAKAAACATTARTSTSTKTRTQTRVRTKSRNRSKNKSRNRRRNKSKNRGENKLKNKSKKKSIDKNKSKNAMYKQQEQERLETSKKNIST